MRYQFGPPFLDYKKEKGKGNTFQFMLECTVSLELVITYILWIDNIILIDRLIDKVLDGYIYRSIIL